MLWRSLNQPSVISLHTEGGLTLFLEIQIRNFGIEIVSAVAHQCHWTVVPVSLQRLLNKKKNLVSSAVLLVLVQTVPSANLMPSAWTNSFTKRLCTPSQVWWHFASSLWFLRKKEGFGTVD